MIHVVWWERAQRWYDWLAWIMRRGHAEMRGSESGVFGCNSHAWTAANLYLFFFYFLLRYRYQLLDNFEPTCDRNSKTNILSVSKIGTFVYCHGRHLMRFLSSLCRQAQGWSWTYPAKVSWPYPSDLWKGWKEWYTYHRQEKVPGAFGFDGRPVCLCHSQAYQA